MSALATQLDLLITETEAGRDDRWILRSEGADDVLSVPASPPRFESLERAEEQPLQRVEEAGLSGAVRPREDDDGGVEVDALSVAEPSKCLDLGPKKGDGFRRHRASLVRKKLRRSGA